MKKRLGTALFLLLPVLLLASEGAAAEGGAGHHGWLSPIWGVPAVAWQFVNLGLVAGLFYYLLRWRLPNVIRKRNVDIENALEKARKEKKESLAVLKELEEKMARLEEEVLKIETEAREAADREKARLTESARESAAWLRKEADEEFSRREREAERKLRTLAVEEALRMAREQVRGSIGEKDEERLFNSFAGEVREKLNG